MKSIRTLTMVVVVLGFVATQACDSDTPENNRKTGSGACEDFETFMLECEADQTETTEAVADCELMDDALVNELMVNMFECLFDEGCDGMIEPEGGWTEEEDPFNICFEDATWKTAPPKANTDFVDAYCEFLVGCDPEITDQNCTDYMKSEGVFFYFVDEPYVTDLTACVKPIPECSEGDAVELCLEDVLAEIAFLENIE